MVALIYLIHRGNPHDSLPHLPIPKRKNNKIHLKCKWSLDLCGKLYWKISRQTHCFQLFQVGHQPLLKHHGLQLCCWHWLALVHWSKHKKHLAKMHHISFHDQVECKKQPPFTLPASCGTVVHYFLVLMKQSHCGRSNTKTNPMV